jgi:hypothetical protein
MTTLKSKGLSLSGRCQKMVQFIVSHADDIEHPETRQVSFGCSGLDVWGEIVKKTKIQTGPLGKLKKK